MKSGRQLAGRELGLMHLRRCWLRNENARRREPSGARAFSVNFYRAARELGGDRRWVWVPPRRPTTAAQPSLGPDCIVARLAASRRGIVREGARSICPIWARSLSQRIT